MSSNKLVGYRFSPTVQEVLHTIALTSAPVELENVGWDEEEKRKELYPKSPTLTLPFLENEDGILSESKAIELYLCQKFKPELLGANDLEKVKVHQWIDFATLDLNYHSKNLIYPIFGWEVYDKEKEKSSLDRVKKLLGALNKQLEGKKFILGDNLTLADVVNFRFVRPYFQLVLPEGLRNSLLKNVVEWFKNIANSPEAIKAYGKTVMCKSPVKVAVLEKKEDKKKDKKEDKKKEEKKKEEKKDEKKENEDEEEKPKKKKQNPLDLLPPSKLNLEDFKRAFLNNKDKKDAMEKFWAGFDPEGYSLWWLEYQNLDSECKVGFMTSNNKGMFLQKLDNLRKYAFAVHGVYGVEGDYKIRGVWMWRGTDVPDEMKEHDSFPYYTVRKLDINKPEDKQLVDDYWTKLNPEDEVEGRKAYDAEYFN
jgi:elongation factor 1-gamma